MSADPTLAPVFCAFALAPPPAADTNHPRRTRRADPQTERRLDASSCVRPPSGFPLAASTILQPSPSPSLAPLHTIPYSLRFMVFPSLLLPNPLPSSRPVLSPTLSTLPPPSRFVALIQLSRLSAHVEGRHQLSPEPIHLPALSFYDGPSVFVPFLDTQTTASISSACLIFCPDDLDVEIGLMLLAPMISLRTLAGIGVFHDIQESVSLEGATKHIPHIEIALLRDLRDTAAPISQLAKASLGAYFCNDPNWTNDCAHWTDLINYSCYTLDPVHQNATSSFALDTVGESCVLYTDCHCQDPCIVLSYPGASDLNSFSGISGQNCNDRINAFMCWYELTVVRTPPPPAHAAMARRRTDTAHRNPFPSVRPHPAPAAFPDFSTPKCFAPFIQSSVSYQFTRELYASLDWPRRLFSTSTSQKTRAVLDIPLLAALPVLAHPLSLLCPLLSSRPRPAFSPFSPRPRPVFSSRRLASYTAIRRPISFFFGCNSSTLPKYPNASEKNLVFPGGFLLGSTVGPALRQDSSTHLAPPALPLFALSGFFAPCVTFSSCLLVADAALLSLGAAAFLIGPTRWLCLPVFPVPRLRARLAAPSTKRCHRHPCPASPCASSINAIDIPPAFRSASLLSLALLASGRFKNINTPVQSIGGFLLVDEFSLASFKSSGSTGPQLGFLSIIHVVLPSTYHNLSLLPTSLHTVHLSLPLLSTKINFASASSYGTVVFTHVGLNVTCFPPASFVLVATLRRRC
ncbi:hypothetical protein C8R45DRAFT_1113712 [Mycena sanguinolenta]|nr:hypothetical protein C8R45DRAFT_1113712 [Mycena sanguinolenta]